MGMTPEGKVKAELRKVLSAKNWTYNTTTSRGLGASGQADYTVNAGGRYVPIETKVDKPAPTKLQDRSLRRHAQAGALGLVLARTGLRVYPPDSQEPFDVPAEDLKSALRLMTRIIERHITR